MGRAKRATRSSVSASPQAVADVDGRRSGALSGRVIWIALAVAACLGSALIGVFTPPFQSPDEYVHVKMAHLLSHGTLPRWAPDGSVHGGAIDSGLVQYTRLYNEAQVPRPQPVTPEIKAVAEEVRWAGRAELAPCPNIYLPVVYLPQAIALRVGEELGMTVGGSYRLARLAANLTAMALLCLAFALYTPPPLAAAVIVLPMTLFQVSSASIDGVTIGLISVAISAFLRIWRDGDRAPRLALLLMLAMLAITVPSRPYLMPLFALPCMLAWHTRRAWWAVWTAVAAALPIAWLLYAMSPGEVDTTAAVTRARPPLTEILAFYTQNPGRVLTVISRTASDAPTTNHYYESFIGVLGWLDTRFAPPDYQLLYALLCIAAGLSVAPSAMSRMRGPSVALAVCGVVSLLLVFVSLWLLFSPHPTTIIRGVQGRYFAIPVMLLGYALGPDQASRSAMMRWLGVGIVAVILALSLVMTIDALRRKHAPYFSASATSAPRGTIDPSSYVGNARAHPPDILREASADLPRGRQCLLASQLRDGPQRPG
jgi:uncharacterized membrane protein